MANSGYQYREENTLGRYTALGLLRYKDPDAYYCQACESVINIICPRCKTPSRRDHATESELPTFRRARDTFERYDGFVWTQVCCQKCDYLFKVIVR